MKNNRYLFHTILILFFSISLTFINAQPKYENVFTLDDELIVKQIDENTFLAVHSFPWAANNLILKFKDGNYLFIDTPYTDEATEKLVNWLQSRDSSKIKVTVINTHFHIDNLGGNGYLRSIGADIYGSDLTVQLLKERGLGFGMLDMLKDPSMKKYYDYYKDKVLTPPNKLFSLKDGLELIIDGDTMQVYYPGPGHAPDNVVVYYPAKKILFGGCILKSMGSKSKGNLGDADLQNWYSSVEKLLTKFPDAKLVIPGHGEEGGFDLIGHTMDVVK
ncbi:MAG: MBL fold metallo-hydrolase [bacterium]